MKSGSTCGTHGVRRLVGESNASGLSNGFDTWLERHQLATLAYEAVMEISWPMAVPGRRHPEIAGMSSEMMMVLITYCQVTGLYDSEDIAAAVPRDSILRDICAGMRPTAKAVRQFRWTHSDAIVRAFTQVLRKVEERRAGAAC